MPDIFDLCSKNDEFANDCFTNPDVFRSAVAIVDRLILIYGHDIKQAKLAGPRSVQEFDIAWDLGVKEG